MANRKERNRKRQALREGGTLNSRPEYPRLSPSFIVNPRSKKAILQRQWFDMRWNINNQTLQHPVGNYIVVD